MEGIPFLYQYQVRLPLPNAALPPSTLESQVRVLAAVNRQGTVM